MIKKILLSIVAIAFTWTAKSQIFSPELAGYNGFGYVHYPNGYYQGNLINGVANGTGTYYHFDGSFYHGNFFRGFWDGPGVLVTRQTGYVSGCFSQGFFVGQCIDAFNPYQNIEQVQSIVSDVNNQIPDNESYDELDLSDYNITQVSSTTQMGGGMLGGGN
jgi:hypothetical protein